LPALMARRSLR